MKTSLLGTAALFLAAASLLHAQDPSVIGAGTRVRLISPALVDSLREGVVVSATHDTISFKSDKYPVTRAFAVADLTSIQISGGMATHRLRDALYGVAIGTTAGSLIGAATYKKPETCYWFCTQRTDAIIAGGVLGGLPGMLVGAVVVGNYDKTERWIPLRKTASLQLMPARGGVSLAYSRRF